MNDSIFKPIHFRAILNIERQSYIVALTLWKYVTLMIVHHTVFALPVIYTLQCMEVLT